MHISFDRRFNYNCDKGDSIYTDSTRVKDISS